MKVTAIIPSAGRGRRMGHSIPKHYIGLEGRPILAYTLDVFEKCTDVNYVLVVVKSGEEEYCLNEVIEKYMFKKVLRIVIGGERRQDSVYHAIRELDQDTDIVVVHDGVRPFVPVGLISESIKMAMYSDGVVAALPVKDTLKEVTGEGIIKSTPHRESMWYAQTPQTFKKRIVEDAFVRAYSDNFHGTDESSLVERIGGKVRIIEGSPENIKITTKEDLLLAEFILRSRKKRET
jgi:2-C-methyl-D-erythritol 4-phosphate cytidylyltransferase